MNYKVYISGFESDSKKWLTFSSIKGEDKKYSA